MSDVLSRLAPPPGARHSVRRVGRGPGGGKGKTSGKGMKGQKARKPGNFHKTHFQGGQTPIQRRLAKRGFRVPFPIETVVLNVSQLERFADGTTVDEAALRAARLVQGRDVRIKILASGDLTKKLTVHAHGFSAKAAEKIEQAKGKAVVIADATAAATPAA
ncbi:MAG TPA: 50S ribosomal protein L15 [Polyangiaceae bacterium]|jgi:large subunit ribosomal protein L15|nr:50S ribosomal protein L15 [Polyangiaceae bacterium]